jgi:hypothetical protein
MTYTGVRLKYTLHSHVSVLKFQYLKCQWQATDVAFMAFPPRDRWMRRYDWLIYLLHRRSASPLHPAQQALIITLMSANCIDFLGHMHDIVHSIFSEYHNRRIPSHVSGHDP